MTLPDQNKLFNNISQEYNDIKESITRITESDQALISMFFEKPNTKSQENLRLNFEDSFEYIRLYFNSGRYQGYKFHDNKNLIIFALEKKKKPHFKLFKPLGPNGTKKIPEIVGALSSITDYPIQLVCLNNTHLKALKNNPQIQIKNIKEFSYYIYDLNQLNNLRGNRWKNVRQKITAFKKTYPKLTTQQLSPDNYEETIHFIGAWRRQLLSRRGLSYANLEKNKFAAQYYSVKNDISNIWSTVYRLSGRVVAFQMLYRLGETEAAHAIGLADTEVKNLSEFTQVQIWEELLRAGIRYINDGPSWRPGLDRYKQKFNPISSQQVFECKLSIVKD